MRILVKNSSPNMVPVVIAGVHHFLDAKAAHEFPFVPDNRAQLRSWGVVVKVLPEPIPVAAPIPAPVAVPAPIKPVAVARPAKREIESVEQK